MLLVLVTFAPAGIDEDVCTSAAHLRFTKVMLRDIEHSQITGISVTLCIPTMLLSPPNISLVPQETR